MNEEEKLKSIEEIIKDKNIPPGEVLKKIQELYGNLDRVTVRSIAEQINKNLKW
jgi:hypothetical protein